MTESADGVLFTDGTDSVLFHPPVAYPDGPGFRQRVDIISGPFRGSIDASSYAGPGALADFHQQLQAVYESLKGEATLPRCYEDIRMSIKGDGMGHVAVCGEVMAGRTMAVRLNFSFGLDQTHLPQIIKSLERFFSQ
ncbi:MAG TPA: hypothetical protein VHC39_05380 [Rhizomicrobium sp.]|nr:hypothetical protein [Rhizomicrobium sp.]